MHKLPDLLHGEERKVFGYSVYKCLQIGTTNQRGQAYARRALWHHTPRISAILW
jgi:hypothetical protein